MNIDLKNFSKNVNEYIKIQDNTYQDILWIDDIDTQQAQMQGKEIVFKNTWFPDHWEKINILDRMDRSYDEIVTNCDKYNLVIFDMNMENDSGYYDYNDYYQSLKENFLKYNISLPEDDESKDKNGNTFWKTAGIYLYLLLLTKGYPADRMLIYTANSDKLKDSLKFICPALELKITRKDKNDKIKLETSYYPENSYYRIRRLVLQACGYWKKEITDKKDENIPFNRIYFSKDTDQKISKENFKELLERIEMMFPVIQPVSPKSVYYQAARILCEYHENNAAIQKLDKYEDLYTFHLVCRSFRNWSSHNKFTEAEMKAEIFAVVFCIALRTYFDEKQNNGNTFDSTLNYYEEIYFTEKDILEGNYKKACEEIHKKLTQGISLVGFFKKAVYTHKYSHLVHIWGEENKEADLEDILMPIIVKDLDIWPNNVNLRNLLLNDLSDLHIPQLDYADQSDENKFIDLMIKKSIELWSKKSVGTIQEVSS